MLGVSSFRGGHRETRSVAAPARHVGPLKATRRSWRVSSGRPRQLLVQWYSQESELQPFYAPPHSMNCSADPAAVLLHRGARPRAPSGVTRPEVHMGPDPTWRWAQG